MEKKLLLHNNREMNQGKIRQLNFYLSENTSNLKDYAIFTISASSY